MIKVALFDVDGLIIVGRERYFSKRFAEEYNIPSESIEEFFSNEFDDCRFGSGDLKEKIEPYLEKWGWDGTVEDLLKYWFESESTLDKGMLSAIDSLRSAGVKCYIATRQEKYRMQYLWEDLGLQNHFDGYFCSCDIRKDKDNPEFFEVALQQIPDVQFSEVVYFDDKQSRIDVANKLGIEAYHHDSRESTMEKIKQLISPIAGQHLL